ncbi:HRDC domain-containing protein [Deinococcus malanensis]|uniref:HRDC domain-containing protein n=1 Tax=Deinococcus malanensis TaxID=1706855 RepID=UPI0036337B7F
MALEKPRREGVAECLAAAGESGIPDSWAVPRSDGDGKSHQDPQGEQPLLLREDSLLPRAAKRSREKTQAARGTIDPEHRPLFQALKTWRAERAGQLNVPPYVIFGDATLKAIAEVRPHNLRSLGKISGIGERRLSEYGQEVLRLVQTGCTRRSGGLGGLCRRTNWVWRQRWHGVQWGLASHPLWEPTAWSAQQGCQGRGSLSPPLPLWCGRNRSHRTRPMCRPWWRPGA